MYKRWNFSLMERKIKFVVRLCDDVLLEVLCFGKRRRLAKLERIGRRLHRIIEGNLRKTPIIRHSFRVYPRY